jgi:hypothetical protein
VLVGPVIFGWALTGLLVDLELRRHTRYDRFDHMLLRIMLWPLVILTLGRF